MTREYIQAAPALPCPACQARSAAQGDAQARIDALAPHELSLLKLLAQGKTNQEISLNLDLAEKTVRNRTSAIFDILGVHNRTQAARVAWEAGL